MGDKLDIQTEIIISGIKLKSWSTEQWLWYKSAFSSFGWDTASIYF